MAGEEEGGLTEASTVAAFLGVPWDSHRRPPDSVFAPVNRRRAPRALVSMEIMISAVAGDLISRFISSVAQNYRNHIRKEDDRRRLERILLRMHCVVEEAEGRHITNQGMLLQLKGFIEGFYLGYYVLDKIKFQPPEEESIEDENSDNKEDLEKMMSVLKIHHHHKLRNVFPVQGAYGRLKANGFVFYSKATLHTPCSHKFWVVRIFLT
ncbi:uncharacterized protein [Oryza sativa Japonica Group]|uniref:uncharacterized protein isoform X4 n=1 Tax=Oryza sativa subsp. japonica TaxID=39947 RepID=UPI00339CB1CD